MIGCLDCERKDRQIAAMEKKLRLQAKEWERQQGEMAELRRVQVVMDRREAHAAKFRERRRKLTEREAM